MLKAEFKSLQTFSLPTQKHTHTLTQMWKYSHSTVGLFGLFRSLKKTLVDVDVVKLEHCPTSKTHLQSITYPEWDSLPHTNNNVQAFLVPLEAVKHIRWICIWLMEIWLKDGRFDALLYSLLDSPLLLAIFLRAFARIPCWRFALLIFQKLIS